MTATLSRLQDFEFVEDSPYKVIITYFVSIPNIIPEDVSHYFVFIMYFRMYTNSADNDTEILCLGMIIYLTNHRPYHSFSLQMKGRSKWRPYSRCVESNFYHYINEYAPLQWHHNGRDSVSNHQPHHCLLNRLFRRRSKKISKLRVTGLCAGNSPGPVNSPHKWPVMRKMFPFDDVIMTRVHMLSKHAHITVQRSWFEPTWTYWFEFTAHFSVG